MKNYLAEAIFSLRPTAEFVLRENDYSTIEWHVLEGTAPTRAEIDAEIAKIKALEIAAKEAAEAKLAALGLTSDDLKALGLN